MVKRLCLTCALFVAVAVAPALAQTGANVLVVANGAHEGSVRIAEHYARARGVPEAQVLKLAGFAPDPPDDIERSVYERLIRAPIASWLTEHAAQDRILFIVVTKGIPLRVAGSRGRAGTVASVDSELTLLYRRMTGIAAPPAGALPNPYFLGDRPIAAAPPFTHETTDLFLVTRLDGFTVDDALALVDRALKAVPSQTGRFLLDDKAPWLAKGNQWLSTAAARLTEAGLGARVVLDQTSQVLTNQQAVFGYYSWGSNDPAIKMRRFGVQFEPGAIGATFVSSDGRTFREPPEGWSVGGSERAAYYAGSPHSLAADLIREGITGMAGHVAEPFLDGTIRPDILFPAYVAGRPLAEAFYLAMPYVSWQTLVLGDPLCAPFAQRPPGPLKDPAIDPTTTLPTWFSARRVKAAAVVGVPEAAVRLFVRAETRLANGDSAGGRQDLERATEVHEAFSKAHGMLATLYEQDGRFELAYDRYRRQLARDRQNVDALYSLAYGLAVRNNLPREALPFALRAQGLAPRNPLVAHTLGWVYFLLGDASQAARFLSQAARGAPQNAEIRLHLAQLHDALGNHQQASSELARALALDPSLLDRPEVKALQARP